MALNFAGLRESMRQVEQLSTDVAGLAKKIDTTQARDLAPLVAQLASGLAAIEQRLAQSEKQTAEGEERILRLMAELRTSIPQLPEIPDFALIVLPITTALEGIQRNLQTERAPVDPPGLAALMQGMTDVLKGMRDMCARMDKPVTREGVADLPSGQVKLRITETRTR